MRWSDEVVRWSVVTCPPGEVGEDRLEEGLTALRVPVPGQEVSGQVIRWSGGQVIRWSGDQVVTYQTLCPL